MHPDVTTAQKIVDTALAISTLAMKLQIKPDTRILAAGMPKDLESQPNPLPDGVTLVKRTGKTTLDGLILFAKTASEFRNLAERHLAKLKYDALLWSAFPKKSSGIQTDLAMYDGWEPLESAGLEGVRMISFDETWSACRWRPKGR